MPRISVKIKDGVATIKTEGFQGDECLKATEGLSKALGKRISDTPTAEMYTPPSVDSDTEAS